MVMCDCLSFLIAPWRILWRRIYVRWFVRSQSWSFIFPAKHVEVYNAMRTGSPRTHHSGFTTEIKMSAKSRRVGVRMPAAAGNYNSNGTMLVMKAENLESKDLLGNCKRRKTEAKKSSVDIARSHETSNRYSSSGASSIASLFTQQGQKGTNQDAMLIIEDFTSRADTVFCGVFDGHGPHGHLVARNVVDILPKKLASFWQSLHQAGNGPASLSDNGEEDSLSHGFLQESIGDSDLISAWKNSLVKAYKFMDKELLINDHVDCVSSGTTAVTLVKQGNDLVLGNVGDSRAILGTITDDGSLMAIQLTVDLKPDIPSEAERIRRRKGRVFALRNEPSVKRVWLPNHNAPGLAMSRALGDYCLKNYGVISEPEVTHRRLTNKDKFIVLATDGVWDVLSNEQVVKTVASAPVRSSAGKAVVDAAVHAWRSNYATSRVDDCAVICLFLDNFATTSQ